MRHLLLFIALIAILWPATAAPQQPLFFAVLSDPQFGMYAKDQNLEQETANFEFAIANLNRLHPRFVVICGDLVNRTGDAAEIAEYKRVLQKLDPSIPVYNVAGNHDVGNVPPRQHSMDFMPQSAGTITPFPRARYSASYLIPISSAHLRAIQTRRGNKKNGSRGHWQSPNQIQISRSWCFQHIPYFVQNPGEADDYFNIPQVARRTYLDMLEKAVVRYVFAGRTHKSAVGMEGPLTEIVTGAVGMPRAGSFSGFRIVAVAGHKFDSTWFCFGGIPNHPDPQKAGSTPCPQ